jgi:hypothetical protein
MNKVILSFSALLLSVTFLSCGRAAEDRKMMHERAKIFQDSIANVIRASMAEAEGPAAPVVATVVDTAGKNPVVAPGK